MKASKWLIAKLSLSRSAAMAHRSTEGSAGNATGSDVVKTAHGTIYVEAGMYRHGGRAHQATAR
jgi:hypothetical protein